MNIVHTKKFPGTPFIIETEPVQNKPGTWNSTKVSIYRDENLIGEYIRNFMDHGPETFYPFIVDNEWYALYSADYTSTRVMKLHDDRIEDWCGETGRENGFCPVEYYVPRYNQMQYTLVAGETEKVFGVYITDCDTENDAEFLEEQTTKNFVSMHYCNFGFMSGCIWGDDSSWKMRYIDLAQIPNKMLSITEKFGYWELPSGTKLKQCVHMENWEPDHHWITLTGVQHFNLETGERA